ncbi:ZAR1-like protein [Amblyraja radiata]|uniref:ZAR1-like protein n=1 Tax=Amblyraja radiata TaxID=386614 RepID=UPI001403098A|nr:ZAR1-like protein [Amblyraja radiata]
MEGFVYPAPVPYSNAKPRQQNWRQKHYPPVNVEAVEYLDNYKRAQLKAILSQVNPSLTPRLRKANTKEIGIQVNPKVDASVQCSLGPRTLPRQKRRPGSEGATRAARSPSPIRAGDATNDPKETGATARSPTVVRFSRPIAVSIYSPVFDQCPGETNRGRKVPPEEEESDPQLEKDSGPPEQKVADVKDQVQAEQKEDQAAEANASKQRFRFQFLEQKYGYYHCKDCNIRWESAYVWCISGTNKVYFKQFCRKCDKGYNPYRVEAILCQTCFKNCCSCTQKKRHIDPKRPHRQELCGRCRGKRLSCDNTYSFKYIV